MPIEIKKVTIDDIEDIKVLFANYPYKKYQQYMQGLDPECLVGLLVELITAQLKKESSEVIGVRDKGKLVALAELSISDLHSSIYKFRFGKINNFLSYINPSKYSTLLLKALNTLSREKNYDMLSVRLDSDEWENLHILENNKFYSVGTSVKLSLFLDKMILPIRQPSFSSLTIDNFKSSYKDAILSIAASSHHNNHFYNDEHLPFEDTNNLFIQWVSRFCSEENKDFFTALLDGEVIGFAIFLDNKLFEKHLSKRVKILDFIVLKNEKKGAGLGSQFLTEILKNYKNNYEIIELRTMNNNYPALNFYSRIGFKIISSDSMLHKILKR